MKLIIITGISKGLGRALFDLLKNGKKTYIVGVSRNFLKSQIIESQEKKNNLLINADLSTKKGIAKILKNINKLPLKKVKSIWFINNAGVVTPIGSIGTLSNEDILNSIQVNFSAPILIANHLASLKKKLDIVNISSGAANRPIAGWSIYCASKAGAKMFFDVMNTQSKKVRIHQVDPGIMDTGMQADIRKVSKKDFPDIQRFKKFKEDNQLKSPVEVAHSIVKSINI